MVTRAISSDVAAGKLEAGDLDVAPRFSGVTHLLVVIPPLYKLELQLPVVAPKSPSWTLNIMILLSIVMLLWQYGFFARAVPATLKREIPGVPQYVLDYAPLVWLDEKEKYMPSDLAIHVSNTIPYINRSVIDPNPSSLDLSNLDTLNAWGNNGTQVFLTSMDPVETDPHWLHGISPDERGMTNDATSCAIITNDHGDGCVDAFYMYFYSFDQGSTVFFRELGDHIGDWEHNMVRFQDGKPTELWYSQHGNGEAFTYKAVEKQGQRPIAYSARGTHANYAIAGTHDHTIPDFNLPRGLIEDFTSQGKIWDPTLNAYFYNFDANSESFESVNNSPIGAMNFRGKWGDDQYPTGEHGQHPPFFGFTKYVAGPTGPWDKQLNRTKVCPDNGIYCRLRTQLGV